MKQAPPSVLLVDDIEANLTALEAALAGLPCTPVRARSGNDALRLLLKQEVALILLDVQMPDMDGFEVAEHLRGSPLTSDTPIIFLTALSPAEASVLRGYGSGAVDYIVKPFRTDILRSKVAVFLELYAKRRALAEALAEQQNISRELARANETLRHFTQAASHDLHAPLRTIDAFLSTFLDEHGAALDEGSRHYLERSRNAAQRMSRLLHSLLVYSSLRKPAEPQTAASAELVQRAWSDLHALVKDTGAELELHELPAIRVDPERVYQLFLNLFSNAIKFRKKDAAPRIRVESSRQSAGYVSFTVADNGIGMAPKHVERAFQAFGRLHGADQYEGSGLGLTIARAVVEQHGGQLIAESEEGIGSVFHFTLPLA